ncbi:Fur family transcriptional regulator [Leptolyngbya sp. AN03gr2]|uniref:Fur family transcriptional regulator n=1 Tax=unclassified Leptolyngbya TaxID=2650499 RepID=UPI003D31201B
MVTQSRPTRGQARVLELLKQTKQPISAQALFTELRSSGQSLGLATVYRALEALRREGLVQSRSTPQGEALYSYVDHHQHFLTCLRCGTSTPLETCPFQELEKQWQQAKTFQLYYHTLELFGLCWQCQDSPNEN